MTHLLAVVWTIVMVYVAVEWMDRKLQASVSINKDLRGE